MRSAQKKKGTNMQPGASAGGQPIARAGVREIRIAVHPHMSFEELVDVLKHTFVVPKVGGIGGCGPCHSGLDRFVIENIERQGF